MTKRPEVAIIGGGTVGLYLAARLSAKANVVVYEADLSISRAAEVLLGAAREFSGLDGASTGWRSGVGGTSTLWGGQFLRWNPWEFEGTAAPKWPVRASEIDRHYATVLRRLGVSEQHDAIHSSGLSQDQYFSSAMLQIRRSTWLTRRQRDFSKNVSLNRELGGVRIRRGDLVVRVDRRHGQLAVASMNKGEASRRTFDHVVLAAGTFGNSRLLDAFYEGDHGGRVGAGFMDHVSARVASYRVHDWSKFRAAAAQKIVGGVRTSIKYVTRPDMISSMSVLPGYAHWEFSVQGSRLLGPSHQRTPGISAIPREGAQIAGSLARGLVNRERPLPKFAQVYLRVDVEQVPSSSRRLDWVVDSTGERSLKISWDVSEAEKRSARKIGEAVVGELEKYGIGAEANLFGTDLALTDTKHMMGGTVMGASAVSSVVDDFGRVHGTRDLWVAGASVFPSGGMANPTYTALALAERTAGSIVD